MTNGGHPVEQERKAPVAKSKGPAKPSKPAQKAPKPNRQ